MHQLDFNKEILIAAWFMLFRTWLSNSGPARFSYAAPGHILKLCIFYENYTVI